jgi:hypothetical protein
MSGAEGAALAAPRAVLLSGMAEGRSDSPLERAMRRHTWWRFHEIATQATRHLRLSAWETSFILSLVELGTQTDGDTELSDKQLKVLLRLEDRVRVQQLLDLARGDPRLTAWEEGFLTNLANSPAEPSEKQAMVLLRIQDKFMTPAEIEVHPPTPASSFEEEPLPEATDAAAVLARKLPSVTQA